MRGAEKLLLIEFGRLKRFAMGLLWAFAFGVASSSLAEVLPTGAQVVTGGVTIHQTNSRQTITQTTNRAIVNWHSFSIGPSASVNFIQPDVTSVILNRVVGTDPSSIFGSMTANGRVFLVNPNGVFFGPGSSIDTGGLVATTMSISDSDFMGGRFNFERTGYGEVENAGIITIRNGGYALLAADKVTNTATGRIDAPNGNVLLTSADRVTIETRSDGVVGFSVEGNALREVASVENAGLISADGGQVMLSAKSSNELTGMVVNNSGVIRARGIEERDGAIILSGSSGTTQSSGLLDASGKRGGNIKVANTTGTAIVSGAVNATGSTGKGGTVQLLGDRVGLFDQADVNVSGKTGGGTVLVGGDYQGKNPDVQNAKAVVLGNNATITANATETGDGGKVILWSDEYTGFYGKIAARGGALGGNGGFVETSSHDNLQALGQVDAAAPNGLAGEWLLDPNDITIQAAGADTNVTASPTFTSTNDNAIVTTGSIQTALNLGTNVTITTASAGANTQFGDITVMDSITKTLGPSATLKLDADRDINLLAGISTASGALGITFDAGRNIAMGSQNITTLGGNVVMDAGGSFTNTGNITNSVGGVIRITTHGAGALDTHNLVAASGDITLTAAGTGSVSGIGLTSGSGPITLTAQGNGNVSGTTVNSSSGAVALVAQGTGTVLASGINSGSGSINLASNNTSNSSIVTGNIDTTNTVTFTSLGRVSQGASTRITANTVTAAAANNFDVGLNNQVNNFNANITGSNILFKSINNLTVNNVSASNTNGAAVAIRSEGNMTVSGAVSATGSSTGNASISLSSQNNMNVNNNVTATGGSNVAGQNAALVSINATNGNVIQGSGQIKALDTGPQQANSNNLAHFSRVLLQADNASVTTKSVLAQSNGGRAQVDINAKGSITATGTISSVAASQPGVSLNAQFNSGNGNIDTSGANITVTQTAETNVPAAPPNPATTKDINKVADNVGGIGVVGNNLNLGAMSVSSTASSGNALYGIATSSAGDTTFNNVVSTNSDAGISISTTNDRTIKTQGSGLLQGTKALSLTGDRDKGIFNVKTNTASLTVLGGKGVDIDNTAHGSDKLTITALGRISDATTDPNTNQDIPATDKPVGGVRIQSQYIQLLSMDNQSSNSYLFDGTQTNNNPFGFSGSPRQDLVLIANTIDYVPGTIQTKAQTSVQLRPFDVNRNIQLAFNAPGVPAGNTTYYTGAPITGFLNQFNPDSTILFGGTGYNGNINIGTVGDGIAQQISLGDMILRFETSGRVFNNYAANHDTPFSWNDGAFTSAPFSPSPSVLCAFGNPCLTEMTTSSIFIKDSLKQGAPADNRFRDVVMVGTGSGIGGTTPANNGATNTGGGGSGGGGNSSGGGGGSSSGNNNDSGPGGSNAPPSGPSGGGNTGTPSPGSGTTTVTNSPGQSSGNPGGTPGGTPGNPSTPGGNSTPVDAGNSGGGTLAGGGSFSGGGNSGNTGGNNSGNTGGGQQSGNTGGSNPSGGGTLSNGSTPGSNTGGGGTQTANNGGSTGGGSNGSNGNGSSGGGTFSNGSTPGGGSNGSGGGTQVANNGGNSGGFSGGGSSGGGSSNSGGNGSSGGGTLSNGSGGSSNGSGGGTQVANNGQGSGNSGGFSGGGSGGGSSGSGGNGGSSGGGTFSNGSGGSGTQVAGNGQGGSNSGGSNNGSGSAGSGSGNGAGGTSGSGSGGGTQVANNGQGGNSGGFSGGGSSGSGSSNFGGSGSSGGGTFSNGSSGGSNGGSSGGTQLAGNGQGGGNSSGFSGGGSTGSGSFNSAGGGSTGGGSFSNGSGSSSGGTQLAGNGQGGGNSGGFSGGGTGNSSGGSTGGGSGGTSGNGSGSNSTGGTSGSGSGGTQVANNGQGSGSNGSSQGGTSNSGDASGNGQNANNSQTGNGQDGGTNGSGNNANGGDSIFAGGASGGGSGGGTVVASNGTSESETYPECEDEGQGVKQVSRAGQPNTDMLQVKGSGVRVRKNGGSLSSQRASCASASSTN